MAPNDPVVFKILSGVQAGVEVTLADGDYTLGSGPADDVQLIDVSLLPGHARLRLAGTAVELAAGEGTLRTSSGTVLEPKSAFHALEPLDVVTAGTTRFALGPRSANWASVSEEGVGTTAGAARSEAAAADPASRDRLRVLAVPLIALMVLVGIVGWFAFGTGLRSTFRGHDASADVATVRAALDAFPFGRPITVRQEVDGAVYVEGYVEAPVERRALAGALEGTGVPVKIRLWVLQSMRADIKELIGAEKVDVSFDLSPNGRLALSGVIINKARAEAFVSLIRDRIFGVAAIDSGIRTGEALLADVRKLVAASQLQPWLLLRLDKDLIEVDGALPSDKVDAWVGFLQSYADKFSRLIALRSLVQLQAENGKLVPAPTGALVLGAAKVAAGDNTLDLAKLQSGRYDLADVLVNSGSASERRSPTPRDAREGSGVDDAAMPGRDAASAAGRQRQPQPTGLDQTRTDQIDPARLAARASQGQDPSGGSKPTAAGAGAVRPAGAGAASAAGAGAAPAAGAVRPGGAEPAETAVPPLDGGAPGGAAALGDRAADLMRRFKNGSLSADPSAADLYQSLVLLGGDPSAGGPSGLPDWYLPLLSGARGGPAGPACWPGSQLTAATLLPSLFWLDLLGASRSLSLASLPRDQQFLLLEAALDPAGVVACARRLPEAARAADHSLYLREVRRNPGFVRYVAREVQAFSLDVTGVSLGRDRFILTQAGDRMYEGAAPDRGSRLALIGELGLVFQSAAGLSVLVFGPNIDWLVSN